ncbi:DNA polymerase delta subunit POL32 [Nakaseomyces bracarensis]|uniref:DNA polymerase delta subunit POL32 n=1 Tax=Nakaseomyces bracarensis TaxID=273131 RepID=UPI00387196D8
MPKRTSTMLEIDESVRDYISDRLFHAVKPVLFTDLVHEFRKGAEWAKSAMFSYYKGTGENVKFHCVIVCCLSGGRVGVVQDLARVEEFEEEVTDCFIYAFNPMEEVIPFNEVYRHDPGFITIKNSYELVRGEPASESPVKTIKTESRPLGRTTNKPVDKATKPVEKEKEKDKKKGKDMGLRSTALLARMRKEREDKEQERQAELKRRREESQKKALERDPKKSKQMDELSKMFDEDEDDDLMDIDDEERPVTAPAEVGSTVTAEGISNRTNQTQLEESELDEIMDTTAEESLLEIKHRQEPELSSQVKQETNTVEPLHQPVQEPEPETYVDEDGYIVTKRAAQPETKPKPKPAAKTPIRSKTEPSAFKPKKKQGSIESFFKRK